MEILAHLIIIYVVVDPHFSSVHPSVCKLFAISTFSAVPLDQNINTVGSKIHAHLTRERQVIAKLTSPNPLISGTNRLNNVKVHFFTIQYRNLSNFTKKSKLFQTIQLLCIWRE